MRVVHLTKSLYGGAGQYAMLLSEGLAAAGLRSTVATFSSPQGHCPGVVSLTSRTSVARHLPWRLYRGLLNRGATAPFHSIFHPGNFIQPQVMADAEIVHLHGLTGWIGRTGLKDLIPRKGRVFWTAHDLWIVSGGCVVFQGCEGYRSGCRNCPVLKWPLRTTSILELRAKRRVHKALGVIPVANSQWMSEKIEASGIFDIDEIPVVPPMLNPAYLEPCEEDLRATLGIENDRIVVAMGARAVTDPYKGIPEFLKELRKHQWARRNLKLLLFGDGQLRGLEGLDVHFHGKVPDVGRMKSIYAACDIFVSPSLMETFGMTFIEAQALEKPVLGFRVGGVPEAVHPDLQANLVPTGDFRGLAAALVGLVKEGPGQSGKFKTWVESRYSSETVASKQMEIYNRHFSTYRTSDCPVRKR